jgi:hypothetical protein
VLESVEARRIVDQDFLAGRGVRHPSRDAHAAFVAAVDDLLGEFAGME